MTFQEKAREVARLQREFNRRMEGIRQDPSLSALGKRQALEAAHREASDAIAKLRREAEVERQEERQRLLRETFGPYVPATASEHERERIIASYRAALDRAEAANSPEEALRLLRRANVAGDKQLARAIGWRAAERGWNNVLDEVAAAGAVWPERLAELRGHVEQDNPQATFQRRLAFAAPMRPPELDRPLPQEVA